MLRCARFLIVLWLIVNLNGSAAAYSVLTHEQLVDLAWNHLIRPLLLARYPTASAAELEQAHAYAYGGCAIQDTGYYPFGHEFFSDLTHYVRTGDFIMHLLRDARDANEYAFALGALSHYVGDNIGHHDAVNRATALSFPKLAKKFGSIITYDEDPHAHVRTEFAFDISQLNKRRLAPAAYLRFIGLSVSTRLLRQAFTETYGLSLRSVLGPSAPAVQSYRTSVRSLIPRFAHAENVIHRRDFPPDTNDREFSLYLQYLNETEFQKVWNGYRRGPGFLTHLTAILIRIVPKIGPASILAIAVPTVQTESLYIASVNRSIELYREVLTGMRSDSKTIPFIPDRDLDTGEPTKPGAYKLTDETYAKLLNRIVRLPSQPVPADLREDILRFYSDPSAPIHGKQNAKQWQQVETNVAALKSMPARPVNEP